MPPRIPNQNTIDTSALGCYYHFVQGHCYNNTAFGAQCVAGSNARILRKRQARQQQQAAAQAAAAVQGQVHPSAGTGSWWNPQAAPQVTVAAAPAPAPVPAPAAVPVPAQASAPALAPAPAYGPPNWDANAHPPTQPPAFVVAAAAAAEKEAETRNKAKLDQAVVDLVATLLRRLEAKDKAEKQACAEKEAARARLANLEPVVAQPQPQVQRQLTGESEDSGFYSSTGVENGSICTTTTGAWKRAEEDAERLLIEDEEGDFSSTTATGSHSPRSLDSAFEPESSAAPVRRTLHGMQPLPPPPRRTNSGNLEADVGEAHDGPVVIDPVREGLRPGCYTAREIRRIYGI